MTVVVGVDGSRDWRRALCGINAHTTDMGHEEDIVAGVVTWLVVAVGSAQAREARAQREGVKMVTRRGARRTL